MSMKYTVIIAGQSITGLTCAQAMRLAKIANDDGLESTVKEESE